MHSSMRRPRGFTLVEVMIVIAILGLLAAVAIPQFTTDKQDGKAASMASNLSLLRSAIDTYWTEHDDFPGPTLSEFKSQLMGTTNKAGESGAGESFDCGPYLHGDAIPPNPLNGLATITIVDAMPQAADGTSAWIYCNLTGEIRCNATGQTLDGVAFYDL